MIKNTNTQSNFIVQARKSKNLLFQELLYRIFKTRSNWIWSWYSKVLRCFSIHPESFIRTRGKQNKNSLFRMVFLYFTVLLHRLTMQITYPLSIKLIYFLSHERSSKSILWTMMSHFYWATLVTHRFWRE